MATIFATDAWVAGLRMGRRRSWARPGFMGMALGLMLLMSGDGGLAALSCGIDPLEILKSQVKHNVLVFFDTSGSMNWPPTIPPGRENHSVSGDDPVSRMWQAKQAMRDVAQDYSGRINFGILTFPNANAIKPLNDDANDTGDLTVGGGGLADGPFVYVSNDPDARLFYWDPDGDNIESPFQSPIAVFENTDLVRTCSPASTVITAAGGTCIPQNNSNIVCRTNPGTTATPFNNAAPNPPNFGAIAVGDVIAVERVAGTVDSAAVTFLGGAAGFPSARCVTIATPMNWAAGPFAFVWSKTRPTLGFFGNLGRHQDATTWNNNAFPAADINSRVDVYRSFGNVSYAVPYPYLSKAWNMGPTGVINTWPQSDPAIFPSGNNAPGFDVWRKPICNPLTTECKYYLDSRVYRSSRSFRWNRSAAAPNGAANRLVSVTPFVCPPVTPAPVGQELVDQTDLNRPCIEFVDNATGASAIFYYSSAALPDAGRYRLHGDTPQHRERLAVHGQQRAGARRCHGSGAASRPAGPDR